jgi:CheY-like chemotaxis protein/nitrogen-specific signal transduction histidine kinase
MFHQEQKNNRGMTNMSEVTNHKNTTDNKHSLVLAKELKPPLSSMLGTMDFLLTTAMTGKQKEYFKIAYSTGQSLMNSVQSVITFFEIKNNQYRLMEQDCYLIEILDEIIDQLAEKALKKSLNLGYVIPNNFPARIITDPAKLHQILFQLLDNAIKFSHFGDVSLHIDNADEQEATNKIPKSICFKINDRGIGIPKSKQSQIFEPFFKVDCSSDRVYRGLGLGLTIAKNLAEIMNGRLSLESRFGQGTQVSIRLPMVTKAVDKKVSVEFNHAESKNLRLESQKLLLVTASELIKDHVVNTVNALGGQIIVVSSAHAAITRLAKPDAKTFQTIIVDEDIEDMPLSDFFGLVEDCLNFSDIFALILSNPYFAPYHINSFHVARISKPILTANLTAMLVNRCYTAKMPINDAVPVLNDKAVKVLIVDDSRINQHVIEAMLHRLGCDYEITSNGKTAIEKVVYGCFDLVLIDCNVPCVSGYEVARQIRNFEEDYAAKLPIVGMSSNASEKQKAQCINSGMSDHIDKPIGLLELRAMLLKWTPYRASFKVKEIFEASSG